MPTRLRIKWASDFNTGFFTVSSSALGGTPIGTFKMDTAGLTTIQEIGIGTDNKGTNSAFFDNLTVVPEPTGVAMVGLGSLLLLAKRPKRLA